MEYLFVYYFPESGVVNAKIKIGENIFSVFDTIQRGLSIEDASKKFREIENDKEWFSKVSKVVSE